MRKKLGSTLHNYNCSIRFVYYAQLVKLACNACTREARQRNIQNPRQMTVIYNNQKVMFEVTGISEHVYAHQLHCTVQGVGDVVVAWWDARDGVVAPKAINRSDAVYEALRDLASLMLITLHALVEKPSLPVK